MLGLLRRGRHERAGFALYGAAVAAARNPWFYRGLGVADTLDGRFDLVGLHAFLVMRRLRAEGPPGTELAQAVFDAMFTDMDRNLREMGVGDLAVPRKVKQMWVAFNGRAAAYAAGFASADPAALPAALARNVWRGAPPDAAAAALARVARAQDAHLATQALGAFVAGTADFLPPEALPA